MTLSTFLAQSGFRQIDLSRSGVGHFHATGSLSGHSVAVLIDTGAASTVVSLALARQLGLTLTPLEMKGGGAGGAHLDIFQRCHPVTGRYPAPCQGLAGDGPRPR